MDSGGGFWLLKVNEIVFGTIGLKIIDQEYKIGEIKRFFILPEQQGNGYGKFLMNYVLECARNNGLLKLRLDTMKSSSQALSIFRKNGFYEIPKYNNNDIAEIFMEKVL